MYLATQPREGDLEEFFAHESQNFPPSLAVNVEKTYHSRKPDVVVVVVVVVVKVVENIYKAPLVKKTSEVLWLLLH